MKKDWIPWLTAVAIAVVYALVVRLMFDMEVFKHFSAVMSLSFFLTIPFAMGFLTVAFAPLEKVRSRKYRVLVPWVPVGLFLWLTMIFKIEGWACWLMALPFFLLFASIGGLVAGAWKIRRHDQKSRLKVSLVLLLPFLVSPLEKLLPLLPARYEAYTYMDVRAPAATIWSNVVRVRAIPEAADHGPLTRLLGFPRPIRAELNYAGVGGRREAIFSKGLVFEEVIREYDDQKRMVFTIKADPHAIPSTTMDKHVVIGGDYFDVLDGTYALERLNDSVYRLHLYSHFTLRTTFNFYASWWAGLIMKDIQNNILQVIKTRCEGKL
jgi:hypothetical protein